MGPSFCSYRSSYQGGAEPPHQEARRGTLSCPAFYTGSTRSRRLEIILEPVTIAIPNALWAEDAGWWTPTSGPERDPVPEACYPTAMPLQAPFPGLKYVNIRIISYNFRFNYHRFSFNFTVNYNGQLCTKIENFICGRNVFPR
jgi:hypothetical protein